MAIIYTNLHGKLFRMNINSGRISRKNFELVLEDKNSISTTLNINKKAEIKTFQSLKNIYKFVFEAYFFDKKQAK
ncbi:hypothetical protein PCK1_001640 [Pneumocystis canis]|nr:hypothetical protein PCK1_001640 [Pneumocystis canis]